MGRAWKLLIVCLALASSTLFTNKVLAGQQDQPTLNAAQTMDVLQVGDPVSNHVLESLSGRQGMSIDSIDILANKMNLNADMQDNLLYSTNTGINQVTDDAFANASGIFTVVQNSGNQVIINNALILNLQMQ